MKDYFKYFDKATFLIMLLLCSIGVLLIYSAGYSAHKAYYLKQLLWLAVAIASFLALFSVKTENLFRLAVWPLILINGLLLFQFLAGTVIAHTKSWVRFGFFQVQVSEFVKVPLALVLAKYLTTFETLNLKRFFGVIGLVGVPIIFITLQPDFGVSFVLLSFIMVAFLLKRLKLSIILLSLVTAGGIVLLGWSYLKPYQKARIRSFLNPGQYSQTSGYHVIQSKIAIGSGGVGGKGFLKGSQSRYQFLPTRHTDFVISLLGEEMGFWSIGLLFFLYMLFFYRQLKFRFQTDEEFIFVYLWNGLIFFQFMINVAMAIGLFPVLGITLPFISYGGSSLVSLFLGEAILFRIKINSYIT